MSVAERVQASIRAVNAAERETVAAQRRAEVQLGDTACVIGLGLVGQLVVRLLVASGVRVTGLDVNRSYAAVLEKATEVSAERIVAGVKKVMYREEGN